MAQSSITFSRSARRAPRRDYAALNNGLDITIPALFPRIGELESEPEPEPESQETESPGIYESIESDSLTPFESVSQVHCSSQPPAPSSEPSTGTELTALSRRTIRKEKARTSWSLEYFWISALEAKWGQPPKNDRLFVCKRCSWSSTDSARHGSTSNLITHLRTRHGIKQDTPSQLSTSMTSLDRFICPPKATLSIEQALIQWVIQTRQPFTVVEQPSFQTVFEAANVKLPIKCADTLYNRIKDGFSKSRSMLKQDLVQSCDSIALSLDAWTSENQLPILGIIGHWITPNFEKREVVLDFAEIQGPHSGQNLADCLLTVIQELDIAPKVLTITGDNAGNNGTLCDILYTELLKEYEDEDDALCLKPPMRFHGKRSFIRCLAHVINLICKEVLTALGSGSAREAKATLDELDRHKNRGFPATCSEKSTIAKIRLLVLWIARSPQRRQDWKLISPTKQINYDVDTRWNSTYNMVTEAIRLRRELTQFIRTHPEVGVLQLVDTEWSTLEQIKSVLEPFWEYTNHVSRSCPSLVDSLPIYWALDDLLDDVRMAKGQFKDVDVDLREAVESATTKMDNFTRKMDGNILYYVAAVLDPRIKTSLIEAQMSKEDADLITSEVRGFLKQKYPFHPSLPLDTERPSGMPEFLWETLKRVQPQLSPQVSDVDRYLDSAPVSWSHPSFSDGDGDWILKWWKANASDFPCMAQAARHYLSVPSAEVDVERLFSGARDVLGVRRHSMNAETIRWLVLQKEYYDNKCFLGR
jgi:hypothetical protein